MKGDKKMCLALKEEKQAILFAVAVAKESWNENPHNYWDKCDFGFKVPESRASFKVYNLDLFTKAVTSAYRNHRDTIFNKPSTKPTGKPIELIIKEMEAEAEAIRRHKPDLANSILAYEEKYIPESKAEFDRLQTMYEDALDRKRTFKSVYEELHLSNKDQFRKRRSYACESVDMCEKRHAELLKEWNDAYPGQDYKKYADNEN